MFIAILGCAIFSVVQMSYSGVYLLFSVVRINLTFTKMRIHSDCYKLWNTGTDIMDFKNMLDILNAREVP